MPYADPLEAKNYHEKYDRKRYEKKRDELVALLGAKCNRCGATYELEFDHVDPSTKVFAVMQRWKLPTIELLPEIRKCQLLCEQCHILKHQAQHGTKSCYSGGCRCEECRQAQAAYMREYKRKKRSKG